MNNERLYCLSMIILHLVQFNYADLRIIKGRGAEHGEFPFHVLILSNFKSSESESREMICGGSIISAEYIITAAHCLYDEQVKKSDIKVWVLAGTIIYNLEEEGVPGKTFILHPGFNISKTGVQDDIAIITLAKPLNISNSDKPIKAVALPKKGEEFLYDDATIVGFGVTDENDTRPSEVLNTAKINILDDEDCMKILQYVKSKMICAGVKEGGSDTCKGDSGSALIGKRLSGTYVILGISSFGNGCGRKGFPGVYTRVSNYLDWIQQNAPNMTTI